MADNALEGGVLAFGAWSRDVWPHIHVSPNHGTRRVKVDINQEKKGFQNWNEDSRKTFEDSPQGRIQAHMLTHFQDPRYQLTASEKRNMRAIFRSRVWNWLEEQCKDFLNCRPWLAFKRLLSEHDRHTCADLPETIWFTTAVNDWVQFCNGNLPLVREACPHMEEFFQCVTPPDGHWTQADLPDRCLIPLSNVAGNILSLNAVFNEHWLVPQPQQDMLEGGGNLANQPANVVHNEVDYGQVVAQDHVQGYQNEQGFPDEYSGAENAAPPLFGGVNEPDHEDPSSWLLAQAAADPTTSLSSSGLSLDWLRPSSEDFLPDGHTAVQTPAIAANLHFTNAQLQTPDMAGISEPTQQGTYPPDMQQAQQGPQVQLVEHAHHEQQAQHTEHAWQAQQAQHTEHAWQAQQDNRAAALQHTPARRSTSGSDSEPTGKPLPQASPTSPFLTASAHPEASQQPQLSSPSSSCRLSQRLQLASSVPLDADPNTSMVDSLTRVKTAPLATTQQAPGAEPTAAKATYVRQLSNRSSRSSVTHQRLDNTSGEVHQADDASQAVSPQRPPSGRLSRRTSSVLSPQTPAVTTTGQSSQQALDQTMARTGAVGQERALAGRSRPDSSGQPVQRQQSNRLRRDHDDADLREAIIASLILAKARAAAQHAHLDITSQLEHAEDVISQERYKEARRAIRYANILMNDDDNAAHDHPGQKGSVNVMHRGTHAATPVVDHSSVQSNTSSQDGRASLPTLCAAVGLCAFGAGALVDLALHCRAVLCLVMMACLILVRQLI